eukprot:comp6033_c0_seq1/m.1876 comp6033_c0_seq1/g.1876  ORF comp6033_c0_seq1/g.1876 comp6033_c0_seq1/m.1876 type:complete len:226 (-) comp6033_c0_seq1:391-1068(-)
MESQTKRQKRSFPESREVPIEPSEAAILFVDVQNYSVLPTGGCYDDCASAQEAVEKNGYFFKTLNDTVLPNMVRLRDACRESGVEVTYTVIESMTKDGRDRSLDYRLSGINVTKGSHDAKMPDILAPEEDEMVFPKTSCSVFISTNIHYVLGNLGVRYLIICGLLTDQCVNSAVRDACDLGYLVTCVTDACATYTQERHDISLEHIKGFCRRRTTDEVLRELMGE